MATDLENFRGDAKDFRPPRGLTRTHPPFQEGNLVAVRHGAFSEAIVASAASDIVCAAIEAVPRLAAPEYRAAVTAWGRAEARCLLVEKFLEEHGLLDEDGRPRPAADLALRVERQAADARSRLGLDPMSRVKLEQALAASAKDRLDIQAELAEGRRLREAAESHRAFRSGKPQEPGEKGP
jgi:hypothetical protein